MSQRYQRSEALLERALKTIPLGSQTYSKSKTQYPYGASPYFIVRGKGSHVWDVDDNEYVDFTSSLAAVSLGYNDTDVTSAVKAQLEDGVLFSLPHPIEMEVSEKICEMVPCAEMVRFGKNGSDATTGAIRLARAYTGRDHVAVCGYHGWQDWYIGSTPRDLGVPLATKNLTHTFTYNDLDSLAKLFQEHSGEIAAVIMEPMNVVEPTPGFLQGIKQLAHANGAVLIFDETVTGFRFSNGGAQELFDVIPDLATFGKGIANGYPVSVVAGKREIMQLMEEIFFSSTFGGETLSLAASLATMNKLQQEPVIATMRQQGEKIVAFLTEAISKYAAGNIFKITGDPVWSFLLISDVAPYTQWQIKTLFMQEMQARGILTIGVHIMSYAHSDQDLELLFSAYDEVIPLLVNAIKEHSLESLLKCDTLEPLFKVR
ncbi:aspartate aminotransferase family protein [Methylophaga sp. 42_25_T18]|nr:aspartate aminotransferase family protein [Methylophaga sp. 42_25_T18]